MHIAQYAFVSLQDFMCTSATCVCFNARHHMHNPEESLVRPARPEEMVA
jgi:hypothetical protein